MNLPFINSLIRNSPRTVLFFDEITRIYFSLDVSTPCGVRRRVRPCVFVFVLLFMLERDGRKLTFGYQIDETVFYGQGFMERQFFEVEFGYDVFSFSFFAFSFCVKDSFYNASFVTFSYKYSFDLVFIWGQVFRYFYLAIWAVEFEVMECSALYIPCFF